MLAERGDKLRVGKIEKALAPPGKPQSIHEFENGSVTRMFRLK